MMDYRENAGYIITDSCHVGDSEFVLGVHLHRPSSLSPGNAVTGRKQLFWGHFQRPDYRAEGFAERELEERAVPEEQGIKPAGRPRWPRRIPRGEKSRPVKPSAPAFIPFPPQGMAALWCAGNWRKRYSEKKRGLRLYGGAVPLL